jgi:release factor glutamine methyltransferase
LGVRAILSSAAAELAAAGVESPRTDAELLAAHALGIPRGRLLLVDEFSPVQLDSFRNLIADRARRVPLQHLTGVVPFGDIDLAVGPGGFVPRPETELLVEWGLGTLPDETDNGSRPVVVDFCSGTGAIALAVAHARPDAYVTAVERDPEAERWLRRNATDRISAGDSPIAIRIGDVTVPQTTSALDGDVDLLLCNPPYVPDGTAVQDEVLRDPLVAVFGGRDGLSVIAPVITRAVALLKPGAWIGIEHDDTHEDVVPHMFELAGAYDQIELRRDLAGRPRFTTARRVPA